MDSADIARYVNTDVVGQKTDGSFFEGLVRNEEGQLVVISSEKDLAETVCRDQIRWLAVARRCF